MKIKGMTHLRKNDYDSIIINQGQINIYGKSKWASMKLSDSIEDELKVLSGDSEKQERVVEYFLDYSTISLITDNYQQAGRNYLCIGSRCGKMLKFSMQPGSRIIANIFEHYERDRFDFLQEESANYEITASVGTTAYGIDTEGKVKFELCILSGELLPFEQVFLTEYFPIVFGDDEVQLETRYTDSIMGSHRFLDGYYISGNNKTIKIDRALVKRFSEIILNHNSRIREIKKENETYKQLELKMEGF